MTVNGSLATDLSDPNDIGQLTTWDLDFRQISSGSGSTLIRLRRGQLVSTMRIEMSCRVHQTGAAPHDFVTFGLPKPQTISNWLRSDLPDSSLICFGSGHEFDGVSEAGFDGLTISCRKADLENLARSFRLEWPRGAFVPKVVDLSCSSRAAALFVRKSMAFSNGLAGSLNGEDEEELLLALILAFANAKHRIGDRTARNRGRVLRRALELIEAHAEDPPSIRDLCDMCGTSWPTLHRAFVDRFGVSPKTYVTAVRLNKARRDLRSGHVRWVADAANASGFWHMGQFAKEYRELFNRLPSEDLRH